MTGSPIEWIDIDAANTASIATNGYMTCGSVLDKMMHWDRVFPKCPQCGCGDVKRIPPYYSGRFKCDRCGHEWFDSGYTYLGT